MIGDQWIQALIICVVGIAALPGILLQSYLLLWIRARVSRSPMSLLSLIVMSLKGIPPGTIVDCQVMAVQAGLRKHSTAGLEAHSLAGGNVLKVTQALIAAQRAGITLDWTTAAAVDLAGRDVLEAVQTSINPKVIDCPAVVDGLRTSLSGVAQDGIQLNVRVRVTVRSHLEQLIGGATEATVIARVGQGIVAAIGRCVTYQFALTNPRFIAEAVLRRGLDSQTAFSIISIDIEEILVGENIGATLQLAQAQADIQVAQAAAESRRAMAVAVDQEMRVLVQEHRARVVLAEVEIPKAIAQAYTIGLLRKNLEMETTTGISESQPLRLRA